MRAQPGNQKDDAALRAEACKTASAVLPAATASDIAVLTFGRSLETLAVSLLSDELPEAQAAGTHIADEARTIAPHFLEHADEAVAYRQAAHRAVQKLAAELLPENHAAASAPVRLVGVQPRNELDLLPEILYPASNVSLTDLRAEITTWPYSRKLTVMEAYLNERTSASQKPGPALDTIQYEWDILADFGSFRDLQRHRLAGNPVWQPLTPRYGYAMPALIEEAGLSDQFEQCFDRSLELYSQLQTAGYALEAQYAVLLGHNLRWKTTYSASDMLRLHDTGPLLDTGEGHAKLIAALYEKLAEAHPIVADAMQVAAPPAAQQ